MKAVLLSAVVALASAIPMVAFALDEKVTCQDYLEMDRGAQLEAIDAAMAMAQEHGMGRRFGDDATEEAKLNYMEASCTDPEGFVTVAIIDMLGT